MREKIKKVRNFGKAISLREAKLALETFGSVEAAIEALKNGWKSEELAGIQKKQENSWIEPATRL